MTMTIIAEMFKKDYVRTATDVYINWDGASDNVYYQCIYGLAFLLRCARKAGWPLQRIHVLRLKVCTHACVSIDVVHANVCLSHMQVGHTHNQLDGSFGVLCRHCYGRQCGGTTARDLLSFSGFKKVR